MSDWLTDNSEAQNVLTDWTADNSKPPQPPKTGIIKAAGLGFMRGGVAMARGTTMLASALLPWEDSAPDGNRIIPRKDDLFRFMDNQLAHAEKYWTPDPDSVGMAEQIVGAISELPLQFVGGVPGMVMSATANTGHSLVEQGVDGKTAGFAAAGAGAINALMIKLPQAGRTLAETAGLAALNPLLGAGQDYALKKGLESQGYTEQAAAIDPLNPVSRTVDLTLGGVFGAMGYHSNKVAGMAKVDALDNVAARAQELETILQKAGGEQAVREILPVEVVDSLDTTKNYIKTLESNPFNKEILGSVDQHIAALNKALESVTTGKPVDVSTHTENLLKPTPKTLELQTLMDKLSAKYGLAPDEEAGVVAQIQARAKVLDMTTDEFVGKYFADVTNEPPQDSAYFQGGKLFAQFKPLDVSLDAIPRGVEYRLNPEQAQQLADKYGNGTIQRVTDRQFFETGQDQGNPEYGHRFETTQGEPLRGVTSFAINDEHSIIDSKLNGQPGNDTMIHYGVRPEDMGGEFVVVRKGTDNNGQPKFHIYSDSPVNTETAGILSHGLELKAKFGEIAKSKEIKTYEINNDEGLLEALDALGVTGILSPAERAIARSQKQSGRMGQGADGSARQNRENPGESDSIKPSTSDDPDVLYQSHPVVDPFYSKLTREVEALQQNKWNTHDLLNKIRKSPGVKEDEIAWTGLDEFLKDKKSVTKAEVHSFLEENQVQIKEVMKGAGETRYEKYSLAGAENSRELLLTMPTEVSKLVQERTRLTAIDRERPLTAEESARYEKLIAKTKGDTSAYKSTHFDETNILAHVRFNERRSANGERILHIEEVQSDWHQSRRDGKEVPDAPFAKSWHELALRRMLRYAAENGFDRLTWTTGEQQADRYDISKKMDSVSYRQDGDHYIISGVDIYGNEHALGEFNQKQLPDAVGKELSQKIINGDGQENDTWTKLSGADLKVGGAGMKGFYDNIIPLFLKKFGKKFAAKVEDVNLPEAGSVHSITITDAMRDSLLYEGQPLFQGAKAAVSFLHDGRAILHALEQPDFTSASHELAHVFARTLLPEERFHFDRWLQNTTDYNRVWSREQHETFAQAYEAYLADGKAPSPELQPFFDKFKAWFLELYRNIINSPLEMKLHPETKKAFDRMLYKEVLHKELSPEVRAIHQEAINMTEDLHMDLNNLAGDPPPHLEPKSKPNTATPGKPIPARVMRDIAMHTYEDPDVVKRFVSDPKNIVKALADLLETEAKTLEQSDSENHIFVSQHGESVRGDRQWSSAPEWFLEHNRFLMRAKKGDKIAKDSAVNALKKAALGNFDKLTNGQQDMVLAALDHVNHSIQSTAKDIDAHELQVGDHFMEADMSMRTVIAERDGKLIMDNGQTVDINSALRILGEVDQSGRPPQKGYDPLDYDVETLLKERGDFEVYNGKDAAGNDIMVSARDLIETAKNELAATENRKHLYDRAAACMGLEF